jgi:hypothetical protein
MHCNCDYDWRSRRSAKSIILSLIQRHLYFLAFSIQILFQQQAHEQPQSARQPQQHLQQLIIAQDGIYGLILNRKI